MSNNDVIEATAALKGILGIGKAINVSTGNSTDQKPNINERVNKSKDIKSTLSPDQKSSAKKKKVKKNKKNAKGQNVPQSGNQSKSQHQSIKQQQYQAERKNPKTKKVNQFQTPPNNSTKGKKKQNSNFAWSAFQSPPDASSLPLPSFSGSDLFSDAKTPDDKSRPAQISPEKKREDKSIDLNVVAKSVEQLENEVIAAAEAAVASKLIETNSLPTSEKVKKCTEEKVDDSEKEAKKAMENDASRVKPTEKKSEGNDAKSKEPESQSGINLAALTSSNEPKPVLQNPTQDTSLTKFMNVASPKQAQAYQQTQSTLQQNAQNPYSSPQHNPYSRQQQIVTIQVQIPPVLLPGRQMMVHTPAGYPIAVVVPENMRPGMIIPVNVPAPLNFHPHHPHNLGHSPHMQHRQQIPNQYHYPNQNIHHQHPNLHVTPFNQGQDPYYPNTFNHPKPGQQNNPTFKKK